MPPDVHLTTPTIWTCTSILIDVDLFLALLTWKIIDRDQFRAMRKPLTLAAGIFFLLVWTSVMLFGWDWFYAYIFPAWARYALPPIFLLVYALLAWGMAWLNDKLPGNPVVIWCILGGAEGLLSHLYAIYGLGAASKPPIMHGTDPLAVLIFAIFEKAFYWILILLATSLLYKRLSYRLGQYS